MDWWHYDCTRRYVPSPIRILLVEDDNAMAQMCAKLIRRKGHSVIIATSTADALAIVKRGLGVDLVVTDVQMPQMTGIELLIHLRELDAELPVILMTGYDSSLSTADAIALGATGYLIKPFDSDELVASIEKAFRRGRSAHPSVSELSA